MRNNPWISVRSLSTAFCHRATRELNVVSLSTRHDPSPWTVLTLQQCETGPLLLGMGHGDWSNRWPNICAVTDRESRRERFSPRIWKFYLNYAIFLLMRLHYLHYPNICWYNILRILSIIFRINFSSCYNDWSSNWSSRYIETYININYAEYSLWISVILKYFLYLFRFYRFYRFHFDLN